MMCSDKYSSTLAVKNNKNLETTQISIINYGAFSRQNYKQLYFKRTNICTKAEKCARHILSGKIAELQNRIFNKKQSQNNTNHVYTHSYMHKFYH